MRIWCHFICRRSLPFSMFEKPKNGENVHWEGPDCILAQMPELPTARERKIMLVYLIMRRRIPGSLTHGPTQTSCHLELVQRAVCSNHWGSFYTDMSHEGLEGYTPNGWAPGDKLISQNQIKGRTTVWLLQIKAGVWSALFESVGEPERKSRGLRKLKTDTLLPRVGHITQPSTEERDDFH